MRAISATLMLAVCLGLAACERAAEEPSAAAAAAAGAPAATSIKATQAMDLINAEVEPMIWDSATQGGRDRGTLEIELHSLEGPWRWWSRQRRVMSDGQIWWGLFADVTFSVAPEDLAIPVTVTQGAEDRWDVVVSCRSGTCFRMSGSEATGEGTLEQVEAALNGSADRRGLFSLPHPGPGRSCRHRHERAPGPAGSAAGHHRDHDRRAAMSRHR